MGFQKCNSMKKDDRPSDLDARLLAPALCTSPLTLSCPDKQRGQRTSELSPLTPELYLSVVLCFPKGRNTQGTAWFLPREPTKFTFPGPVGLTHKAPCCFRTGFREREREGGGEGWKGSLEDEGEWGPRKARGAEKKSTSTGKELGSCIWWMERHCWLKFSE